LENGFFEQSEATARWTLYSADAAREGSGLDIKDPIFEQHWTKNSSVKSVWFTKCDPEEACDCEGHNCIKHSRQLDTQQQQQQLLSH
jgi:hypothetical protein